MNRTASLRVDTSTLQQRVVALGPFGPKQLVRRVRVQALNGSTAGYAWMTACYSTDRQVAWTAIPSGKQVIDLSQSATNPTGQRAIRVPSDGIGVVLELQRQSGDAYIVLGFEAAIAEVDLLITVDADGTESV